MKINVKATVHRYNNAIKRKLGNQRVTLCVEQDGSYYLEILSYAESARSDAGTTHEGNSQVVQMNVLRMNKESLEAFILNAVELLNMQEVTGGKPLSDATAGCNKMMVNRVNDGQDKWTIF